MSDRALDELARQVRARRIYLGLNQGDLGSRGGPSIVVVGQIERAETNPSTGTLKKLDAALEWAPGSAAAILRGEQPRELPRSEAPGADILAAIERETALIPEAREHLKNQLALLLRIQATHPEAEEVQAQGRRMLEAVPQEAPARPKARPRKRT